MKNIAVILALLFGPFVVLAALNSLLAGPLVATTAAGRISLALVFLFTGLGHFVRTEPMMQMLPPRIPGRRALIYVTGLLEWAMAIGLLIPATARATGMAMLVFLVLVFPSNIYAAIQRIEFGGHAAGPKYLIIRGPLQLLLLSWTWWFAVRPP